MKIIPFFMTICRLIVIKEHMPVRGAIVVVTTEINRIMFFQKSSNFVSSFWFLYCTGSCDKIAQVLSYK